MEKAILKFLEHGVQVMIIKLVVVVFDNLLVGLYF